MRGSGASRWILMVGFVGVLGCVWSLVGMHDVPEVREADGRIESVLSLGDWDAENSLWAKEGYLLDDEPLFFLTEYNADYNLEVKRSLGGLFEFAEDDLVFPQWELGGLPQGLLPPEDSMMDVFLPYRLGRYTTFGRLKGEIRGLSKRAGQLEVLKASGTWVLYRVELETEHLKGADFYEVLRAPVEFFVFVDEGGAVALPLRVKSSGNKALDEAARDYIVASGASWGLLGGYYRVVVGP